MEYKHKWRGKEITLDNEEFRKHIDSVIVNQCIPYFLSDPKRAAESLTVFFYDDDGNEYPFPYGTKLEDLPQKLHRRPPVG